MWLLWLGGSQVSCGRYKDILVLRSQSPHPLQAWKMGATASGNPGQKADHLCESLQDWNFKIHLDGSF